MLYRIDDKLHVKVADFGFSRDVYATQYYRLGHKTRLPVKWMPPESLLDNIYNERSDVVSTCFVSLCSWPYNITMSRFPIQWSYGVTCWEVFSLGRGPYPGVDNAEITDYISNGNRLKQPPLCPDDVWANSNYSCILVFLPQALSTCRCVLCVLKSEI